MNFCRKTILLLIFSSFMSVGWGQNCDENMFWTDCGLPFECNPTCSNPNPPPDCFTLCEIGCFCNEGYIFSDDSFNECVLIENCSEQSLCDEGYVELWGECYTITFTTYLNLSEMGLSGEIPSEIGDLTNLTNLDLGGNQLSGEIPSEIGDLTNLTVLDLGGNQILGEIPSEICNLTNLTELELGGNQLSGEIPSCFGNLTKLTFLHLEYNQLSGEIPSEIGDLTNLIWLNFIHNQLSGEIPSSICNLDMSWSNPNNFNIYENQLCPPYPDCLSENDIGYQDTSECEEIDLGDINGDDSVDILDIVILVNYILSGDTSELDGADINNDGEVNILDVVQLVNIILGVTENTVTDIDGNVYETVQIGGQLWMAENLKVTHYQNNDEIPYIYNDPQYGAYINYSNNANNVGVYGRLYNWFAVNDERGLCPDNWHVPSDDEFKSLEIYLGMSESEANGEGLRGTDEGGKLKEEGNEHWNSPNTGATNETDFTALPGGNRRYETYTNQEIFSGLNRYGFFWSSSEVYTVNAWYRVFSFDYSESNRYHLSKTNAFSIRCVED